MRAAKGDGPRIAILGATGHLGQALTLVLGGWEEASLALFARRPGRVGAFLDRLGWMRRHRIAVLPLETFEQHDWDLAINAVGLADPAAITAVGVDLFRLTEAVDNRILDQLARRPEARYLFLSSGAVYGTTFDAPLNADARFSLPVNHPDPRHDYALVKLHAERKHRAMAPANIVDLRLFGFFSRFQDPAHRFFLADVMRALRDGEVLQTSGADMIRDYAAPWDLGRLIRCCLEAPQPLNRALDLYSAAPVGKFQLLDRLKEEFGLQYAISSAFKAADATGGKSAYHSDFRAAAEIGFKPRWSSEEGVVTEMGAFLDQLWTIREGD